MGQAQIPNNLPPEVGSQYNKSRRKAAGSPRDGAIMLQNSASSWCTPAKEAARFNISSIRKHIDFAETMFSCFQFCRKSSQNLTASITLPGGASRGSCVGTTASSNTHSQLALASRRSHALTIIGGRKEEEEQYAHKVFGDSATNAPAAAAACMLAFHSHLDSTHLHRGGWWLL